MNQLSLGGEISTAKELFHEKYVVPVIDNVGLNGQVRNTHILIDSPRQRVLCGSSIATNRDRLDLGDNRRVYSDRFRRHECSWELLLCGKCRVSVRHRHSGVLPPLSFYKTKLSKVGEALLDAACPNPLMSEVVRKSMGKPVPWLVFADWLDEQGDSLGELIRVMVEVCQRDLNSPVKHYLALVTRAWEAYEERAYG